jgi:hypothetical protein
MAHWSEPVRGGGRRGGGGAGGGDVRPDGRYLCWRRGSSARGPRAGAGRVGVLCVCALFAAALDHGAAEGSGQAATRRRVRAVQGTLGWYGAGHGPAALAVGAPLLAMRLKGGRGCTGTRNSVKQRKYRIPAGVQKDAKRNRPIALSHRPCSGPKLLSQIERLHGAGVVQQVREKVARVPPFSFLSPHGSARP